MEESEEGGITALINEAKDWISQWFSEIYQWSSEDVDNGRLMWLFCYGLPFHAWCLNFFKFISSLAGECMCSDEETEKHMKLDVSRLLIRTKYSMVLHETMNVEVNDKIYRIKLLEDMHGPKKIVVPKDASK